jgi:hypothetical protein
MAVSSTSPHVHVNQRHLFAIRTRQPAALVFLG